MSERVFNFSAGPAVLPLPVLQEARDSLLNFAGTGISILEHSHRGKAFLGVYEETVADCRELLGLSDDYHVLFLQGGASTQFCMLPMNLLRFDTTADYLITGSWSQKAAAEARRFGRVHVACSSEDRNFQYIPQSCDYSDSTVYVHYTSNNTIYGTQFASVPAIPDNSLLACDASSDYFSRPLDVNSFGIVYGGAQKNLGPSGVTLVIIRDDLLDRGSADLPTMMQYRTHADKQSAYNTPPTFAVYVVGLVFRWLKQQGGLTVLEERNRRKANTLYDFLDQSTLFKPVADPQSRSMMNVTFVTGDPELDARFVAAAEQQGLVGLKGHRSVGGMRASLYNAFPEEGVTALVDCMKQFESGHAL